jgi:molybdopterin converting factor small subunit
MGVTVVLPRALIPYASGRNTLTIGARCASVADALSAVRHEWPGVLDRIMTEQGEVREHVNIFVGEESIRFAEGLKTPVKDGDTLMIVAAVSGG